MRKKLELIGNCTEECLNSILAYAIMIVVLRDFIGVWPGMNRLLPFLTVPLCLYLIREYEKKAFLFFVLHFAVWILAVYVLAGNDLSLRILFGIAALIFVGISIYQRLSSKESALGMIHPVVMTLAVFLLYIVDETKGNRAAGSYLILIMFVYLLVYLLCYYLQRFLQFIQLNTKTTRNIQVRRIFSVSFGMVSILILLLLGITFLLINKEWIDAAVAMIGEWIQSLIRMLAQMVGHTAMPYQEEVQIPQKQPELFMEETVSENKLWSAIAYYAAMILGSVCILVLLAAVIIAFFRLVRQVFGTHAQKSVITECFYEEKVEDIKREKRKKLQGEKKISYSHRADMQIRKQYVKAMLSKKSFLKVTGRAGFEAGTARENTINYLQTAENKKEAAQTFYTTYEKARYGQDVCDKTDLKNMKQSRDILLKN